MALQTPAAAARYKKATKRISTLKKRAETCRNAKKEAARVNSLVTEHHGSNPVSSTAGQTMLRSHSSPTASSSTAAAFPLLSLPPDLATFESRPENRPYPVPVANSNAAIDPSLSGANALANNRAGRTQNVTAKNLATCALQPSDDRLNLAKLTHTATKIIEDSMTELLQLAKLIPQPVDRNNYYERMLQCMTGFLHFVNSVSP